MMTQLAEQILLNLDSDTSIMWKPAVVPNKRRELYDGLYECSNIGGMIRDAKTKRILPMWPSKGDYMRLHLKDKKGVVHTESVHRIIAATFCNNPHPEEYTDVNHIDGNPMNNDASNLEWTNKTLNQLHRFKIATPDISAFKLIFAIKGNEKLQFNSVKEASLALNVSERHITLGLDNRRLQHKTKGYILIGFKLNELKDIIVGKIKRKQILEGINLEEYI